MVFTSKTGLKIIGVSANCGNGTLGKNACKSITNLLSTKADLIIINCQEVSLREALNELKKSIQNTPKIEVAVSKLRVTRTKIFSLNVLLGNTGIATIVIYNKDKVSSAQFDKNAQLNTLSGDNSNKGANINQLLITDHHGNHFTIKTIAGHLGSYKDEQRVLDWKGIKAATACQGTSWEELVAHVPNLLVAGYDANTRSLWKKQNKTYELVNLWHQQTLSSQIAPLFFAPIGTKLYSEEDTYKLKITTNGAIKKTIKADKRRSGYANAGSLDFVAIQNNTDDSEIMHKPLKKHYHNAHLSITTEPGTIRDHQIIVSDEVELNPVSSFKRIRHDIAAQLLLAAPNLSREILLLTDTPENRLHLVKVYSKYLSPQGKLIRRIQFDKTVINTAVEPWFHHHRLNLHTTPEQFEGRVSQVSVTEKHDEHSHVFRL